MNIDDFIYKITTFVLKFIPNASSRRFLRSEIF